MTSHTTRRFREAFAQLPASVQRQAREAYKLFKQSDCNTIVTRNTHAALDS